MSQTHPPEISTAAGQEKRESLPVKIASMPVRMVLFALCLGCIVMFGDAMLRFAFTPDLGWILQTGNWLLAHQQLPSHDVFSWTYPAKPWVLYQWLFEAGTAWAWGLLGEDMMIRLFTVATLALYVGIPLWRSERRKIPLLFGLLVPCLALFTSAVNISLRPMAVTALFLAVQYLLLERYRHKAISFRPLLGILAVIYALWGNLHTGVVMGLFSLGLTLLGDTLEWKGTYRNASATEGEQPRCPGAYILILLLCFGASLINPYGFGIYSYLANLSGQSYLNQAIVELQSPNFHFIRYWIFAILLGVMILLMTRARQVMSASAWVHVLSFSLLTLLVQRFVVWSCLYYALIFPGALYAYWHAAGRPFPSIVSGFNIYRPLLAVLAPVTLLLFLFWPKALAPVSLYLPVQHGACEPMLPGINAYQKLALPTDRLLNDSDTGSCLIYVLPEQKVFIDTRFDFYAQKFVKEQRDELSLLGDFDAYLKRWEINTVMVTRQWPAYYAIKKHPGHTAIYEDKAMGIFRSRTEKAND